MIFHSETEGDVCGLYQQVFDCRRNDVACEIVRKPAKRKNNYARICQLCDFRNNFLIMTFPVVGDGCYNVKLYLD